MDYKIGYVSDVFKVPKPDSVDAAQKAPVKSILTEKDLAAVAEHSTKVARANRVANYDISSDELVRDFDAVALSNRVKYGIVLDMETLGNHQTEDFFSPVEISMRTYKINHGFNKNNISGVNPSFLTPIEATMKTKSGSALSSLNIVLKPNETTQAKLEKIINALQVTAKRGKDLRTVMIDGESRFLTADEYRTLAQLMKYSDASAIDEVNFGSFSAKVLNPLKSKSINIPEGAALAKHIDKIQQGYRNLMQNGTSMKDAIAAINAYVGQTTSNAPIRALSTITVNGKNFDLPIVQQMGQHTDFVLSQIKHNLDIQNTVKTFVPNTMELIDKTNIRYKYAASKLLQGSSLTGGLLRLENWARGTGFTGAFHTASVDVEATAHVVNEIMPYLHSKISNIKSGASSDNLHVDLRHAELASIQNGNIIGGTTFFAHSGMPKSYQATGYIYKKNQDGKFVLTQDNVNAPIYKDTYYKMLGINKINDKQFGMYLYNVDEDQLHVLTSDNEKALKDIFYRTMEADDASRLTGDAKFEDRAMRRFRKMFDVNTSGTRDLYGFDLFVQNNKALEVLNDFKAQHPDMSKSDLLNAVLQDTNTSSKLASIFSRSYADPNRSYRFTPTKVRDLVYMSDQLQEIRPLYDTFMQNIGKAGLDADGASLALKNFYDMATKTYTIGQYAKESAQIAIYNPSGNVTNLIDEAGNLIKRSTPVSYIDATSTTKAAQGIIRAVKMNNTSPYKALSDIAMQTGRMYNVDISHVIDMISVAQNNNNPQMLRDAANELADALVRTHITSLVPSGKLALDLSDTKGLNDILQQAIGNARVLTGQEHYSEEMRNILNNQTIEINKKRAIAENIFGNATQGATRSVVLDIATPEEAIAKISNAFADAHMNVMLLSGESDGLKLVAFAMEDTAEIMKLTPSEIINNSKAAVLNMPILNSQGVIELNPQWKKLNQYRLVYKNGRYAMSTNYDLLTEEIAGSAKLVRNALDKYGAPAATDMLKRSVYEATQTMSGSTEISRIMEEEDRLARSSKASMMYLQRKSNTVVVNDSEIIKQFLLSSPEGQAQYNKIISEDRFHKFTESDIPYGMANKYSKFIEGIPIAEKNGNIITLGEIVKYGSTKESEALKHVYAVEDIREYLPFGEYASAVHPATIQSLNTWQLPDVASQYMKRPYITTQTMANYIAQNQSAPYVPLVAKYMDDAAIYKKLDELGIKRTQYRPSTYEGQIIMRESVAKNFITYEESKIPIDDKFSLIRMNVPGMRKKGREVTLGGVVQNTVVSGANAKEAIRTLNQMTIGKANILNITKSNNAFNISYIDTGAPTTVKYSDVLEATASIEEGTQRNLVLRKYYQMENAPKISIFGSTTKGTVNILPDKIMDAIAGDAEIVMQRSAIKKYSPDELLRSAFNYALYNANNIPEKAQRETAMQQIAKLIESIEGQGTTTITAGSVVIDATKRKVASPVNMSSVMSRLQEILPGVDFAHTGMELVGRTFVSETLKITGDLRKRGGRYMEGVFKVGPREISAMKSLGIITGAPEVADMLGQYTRNLAYLYNPELGAPGTGYAYMDFKTGQYVTTGGEQVPGKLQSYVKAFKNEASSVMISANTPATDLTQNLTGQVVLNADLFKDVMRKKELGRPLTNEDYSGTILDIQNYLRSEIAQLGDHPESQTLKSNYETILKRIYREGGFTLELPESVEIDYGQHRRKIDKLFVPLENLVKYGTNEAGEDLITVQSIYKDIFNVIANSQTIMHTNDASEYTKAMDNLTKGVQTYFNTLAEKITGKEGLIPAALSARYPNSGQFRVNIISPEQMHGFGIEENTVMINPKDLQDIAEGRPLPKDIYGLVNRYPTTYSQSMNVAKVVAGEGIQRGTMLLTPGMLYTMLGDADGDMASMSLVHYTDDMYKLIGIDPIEGKNKMLTGMQKIYAHQKQMAQTIGTNIYNEMEETLKIFGMNPENITFTADELTTMANAIAGNNAPDTMRQFMEIMEKGGFKTITSEAQAARLEQILSGQTQSSQLIEETLRNIEAKPAPKTAYEASAGMLRQVRRNIGSYSNISYKMREIANTLHDLGPNYITASDINVMDKFMQSFEQSVINTKSNKVTIKAGMSIEQARAALDSTAADIESFAQTVLNGSAEDILNYNAQYKALKSAAGIDINEDFIRQFTEARDKVRYTVGADNLYSFLNQPANNIGISSGLTVGQLNQVLETSPVGFTPQMDELASVLGKQQEQEFDKRALKYKMERMTAPGGASGFKSSTAESAAQAAADAAEQAGAKAGTKAAAQNVINIPNSIWTGAAAFVGAWALTAFLSESPQERAKKDKTNAEELQRQQNIALENHVPVVRGPQPQPTARVVQEGHGYERLDINIRGSGMSNMTNDEIIRLVTKELQNQSPFELYVNARSQDDTSNVNQQWVNDVVSRATRYGMAF